MKLYFQNSQGKEIFMADVEDDKQAMKKIRAFCSERDFEIPYVRCWEKDGRLWHDVGSYTECFILDLEQ